ncbi:MAG: class I SAM-dependent methyltransferase [Phycisphaerales bacterium]
MTDSTPLHSNMAGIRVNLGCGSRYHKDWCNYDLTPLAEEVKKANFLKGIPLPNNVADAAYHSHVLEHLDKSDGEKFLGECLRILKPGGTLRIVVPDLEAIIRDYLTLLTQRRNGESLEQEHLWILVELYDQTIRTRPGGMMAKMMKQAQSDSKLREFIAPRLVGFGKSLLVQTDYKIEKKSRFLRLLDFLTSLGHGGRMLSEAIFRSRGEIHRWMYDELSLGDTLRRVGFESPTRCLPSSSRIAHWTEYGLDTEPDGTPYKGMSLYMEAVKPTKAD